MDKKELVQDMVDIIETGTAEDFIDTLRGYWHLVDKQVIVDIKTAFNNYLDNMVATIDRDLKVKFN